MKNVAEDLVKFGTTISTAEPLLGVCVCVCGGGGGHVCVVYVYIM